MEVYSFNVPVSKPKSHEYPWCEVRFANKKHDYSIIYKYIYDCQSRITTT